MDRLGPENSISFVETDNDASRNLVFGYKGPANEGSSNLEF